MVLGGRRLLYGLRLNSCGLKDHNNPNDCTERQNDRTARK